MMKRRILVAATLVALILSMVVVPTARPLATAMAQSEPPSPELFADPPAQTEALLLDGIGPEDQWVIRSRFVAVNYGVLSPQTGSVTLNLFPDASFEATLESSTVPDPEQPDRFIWRGVLNGILAKRPRHGRRWVYSIALVIFAILALEEFKPLWGASEYYDTFDVLASGFGSLVAIVFYEIAGRTSRGRQPVNVPG